MTRASIRRRRGGIPVARPSASVLANDSVPLRNALVAFAHHRNDLSANVRVIDLGADRDEPFDVSDVLGAEEEKLENRDRLRREKPRRTSGDLVSHTSPLGFPGEVDARREDVDPVEAPATQSRFRSRTELRDSRARARAAGPRRADRPAPRSASAGARIQPRRNLLPWAGRHGFSVAPAFARCARPRIRWAGRSRLPGHATPFVFSDRAGEPLRLARPVLPTFL